MKKKNKIAEEDKVVEKRTSRAGSKTSALPSTNGLVPNEMQRTGPIKDIPQLREGIHDLIKRAAETIAIKVIEDAKSGQLPAVKYLFEFAGLHPATEQTTERPIETTLAHTLLTRMGLPIEPLVEDEDRVFPKATMNRMGEVSGGDTVK